MPQEKQISDDSTEGLKGRTIRGGAVVFGNMLAQKALLLVIYGVLARLLTPRDYGLLGMVFVINAFLGIFYDAGLSQATVQKPNLNHRQISTIFWLNLALGCCFGAVMASIAPAVSRFYKEPLLVNVTLLMALAFPLSSIGTQHGALLRRRMDFGKAAVSRTVAMVVGGVVAIFMALRGYGVYALIAQTLAQEMANSAGNWLFARWIPGLPVKGSGVRGMLRFGGYLTGFYFVNYFAQNLDKILLGRFAGAAPLGLYTRAYAIMMYPVGLVSEPTANVMVPALAKLQDEKKRLRQVYLKFLTLIGFVVLPLMAWVIICHKEIIAVLYGSKWMAAAPIFAIICIGGIWRAFSFAINQIYVAVGRTDRQFRVGLFTSTALCVAFAAGIGWGLNGIAIAFSVGNSAVIVPYLFYACATVGLKLGKVLSSILPTFLAALIMVAAQSMINTHIFSQTWKPAVILMVSFPSAVLIYAAVSLLINRRFVYLLLDYVKEVVPIFGRNGFSGRTEE